MSIKPECADARVWSKILEMSKNGYTEGGRKMGMGINEAGTCLATS